MKRSDDLVIRVATSEDATLLATLGAQTFSETFANDNTPEDMVTYLEKSFNPEQLTQEIADPLSTFLLVEIANKAVGYAKLRRGAASESKTSEKAIELVRLYVLQAHLGQGVGAALMQACIEKAKGQSFDAIWLGVWEHNTRAQSFYQKWGFEVVSSHIFQLGNDAQTDLLLKKDLRE